VARELGLSETSLRNWVRAYREAHATDEPPLELSERARLRELERQNREVEMENAFLKKSGSVLCTGASVSDKYAFIDAEYAAACAPSIGRMCRWLQVSRSGYYEWLNRPPSATAQLRQLLKIKIQALFDACDGTCGYRRLHAELVRGGERVGPELVRALMRELGLVTCQPRPWRTTTIRGEQSIAPRPGRAGLHRRGAGMQTRRRHHLHPHLGRLVVPGGPGDRLLQPGIFYNRQRLHSALGYRTPHEVRIEYLTSSWQHEITQIKPSGKRGADHTRGARLLNTSRSSTIGPGYTPG
jgi:hypothetical protein